MTGEQPEPSWALKWLRAVSSVNSEAAVRDLLADLKGSQSEEGQGLSVQMLCEGFLGNEAEARRLANRVREVEMRRELVDLTDLSKPLDANSLFDPVLLEAVNSAYPPFARLVLASAAEDASQLGKFMPGIFSILGAARQVEGGTAALANALPPLSEVFQIARRGRFFSWYPDPAKIVLFLRFVLLDSRLTAEARNYAEETLRLYSI